MAYYSFDDIKPFSGIFEKKTDSTAKALIKKALRTGLSNNPKLRKVLRQNNAEGKFIKSVTEQKLREAVYNDIEVICDNVKSTMSNPYAISQSMTWRETNEGHQYWDYINTKYRLSPD